MRSQCSSSLIQAGPEAALVVPATTLPFGLVERLAIAWDLVGKEFSTDHPSFDRREDFLTIEFLCVISFGPETCGGDMKSGRGDLISHSDRHRIRCCQELPNMSELTSNAV